MSVARDITHAEWSRDLPLDALLVEHGSPLWVMHEGRLRENLRGFVAVTGDAARVFFPVKSNPTPALLAWLARAGAGADCASRHEVRLALLAGVPHARILYTSPAPDRALVLDLLRQGARVVLDHADDVRWLEERAGEEPGPWSGRLMLRVHPALSASYAHAADYQDLTAHAGEVSKFGLTPDELLAVARATSLRIDGLHLHVGTQMDNLAPFTAARGLLEGLGRELRALGHPVRLLDMGGGLGLPFASGRSFPGVDAYARAVLDGRDGDFDLAVEPGHALVGDAVALLTRVLRVKRSGTRRIAICDAGTDLLAKVTLLRWPHRVLRGREELCEPGDDVLAGPLCFGGDNLLTGVDLSAVQEGDVLCVRDAGAYCAALANRFNGRHAPATVWIPEDGPPRRVQAREDPGLDPQLQTALWRDAPDTEPHDETERCLPLSSRYLHALARDDAYDFTRIEAIGPRALRLHVQTRAEVPFLAAPFALRIVGDAAIVLVLRMLGASEKRVPVWARRIVMDCAESLPAGAPVVCTVRASAISAGEGSSQRAWVYFDLGEGRCTGRMEVAVEAAGSA